MKLSAFKQHLEEFPSHQLRFVLPDGAEIEPHAHITEVGRIDKKFIDCGATVRAVSYCSLQAWVADDVDHRIRPGQLASIIEKASPLLGADDLEVEIEYEAGRISQFPVRSVETQGESLQFFLATKRTDCLAKEQCLPGVTAKSSCDDDSCCC